MNAKEIREQFGSAALEKVQNEDFPYSHGLILGEIAAQLAEQNEKLNILLNPPWMCNSEKIDFSEFENLSELHRPVLTVNQERATLRDQFAMAALAGLLSDPTSSGPKGCAKAAYEYADAILEARK